MYRKLIQSYRQQASQQLADAAELASGAWRIRGRYGDQSKVIASAKRVLAKRLRGLADAYERMLG